MHFNSDKFECMRLWSYLGPDGNVIEVKQSLKDLGVTLNSDLSFNPMTPGGGL